MRAALAVPALLLIAACGGGGDSGQTVDDVAADIGCTNVTRNDNSADIPEVDCTLNGDQVTITDWSDLTEQDKRAFLDLAISGGYQVIAVTDDITAGAESMAAAQTIHKRVGGQWLSAG